MIFEDIFNGVVGVFEFVFGFFGDIVSGFLGIFGL